MILYLAGSFPHLYSLKKEKELMEKIEKKHEYHRLTSFYYPQTCNTVLQLKGERMGIEPVLAEKKSKGKTGDDFEKLVKNSQIQIESLMKRYPWILSWRWAGDIAFKAGRRKTEIKKKADAGEEVSFGANMIVTYLDEKNKKRETQMLLRHKDKPFYSFNLKSWEAHPTKEDLQKQMKGIWIYLSSGGTIENPKAVVLTTLGEYPIACLKHAEAKGQKGRFSLSFSRWIKFTLRGLDIFGEDAESKLFEKIKRRE